MYVGIGDSRISFLEPEGECVCVCVCVQTKQCQQGAVVYITASRPHTYYLYIYMIHI